MAKTWQDDAEAVLGGRFVALARIGGGDFAEAFQATLADGRVVFVKHHRNPPEHFFSTEAAGLSWLREAGCVRVPEVLGVSDERNWLALEWIDVGGRSSRAEEAHFGRALAELHRFGAPCFGRLDERTTGSLGVPNTPCSNWSSFYAECRLLPLARIAQDRGALPQTSVAAIESLAAKLDEFGASDEGAARLHGDLWAGNRVLDSEGQSWIVDPAAHAGHREFDLAMMRLFGGFDAAVFAAYDEVYPLSEGWQSRVPLHQLAPLIVHAIKFGGGYVRGVQDALSRYAAC